LPANRTAIYHHQADTRKARRVTRRVRFASKRPLPSLHALATAVTGGRRKVVRFIKPGLKSRPRFSIIFDQISVVGARVDRNGAPKGQNVPLGTIWLDLGRFGTKFTDREKTSANVQFGKDIPERDSNSHKR
jgi:hypothetical protein